MKKNSVFPVTLPKLAYCKLGTKKHFPFLLNFTGRHIRNGCFFDSLFLTWVIIKCHSAIVTISTNLFLALGMTSNWANVISKHGQKVVKKSLGKVRNFAIHKNQEK